METKRKGTGKKKYEKYRKGKQKEHKKIRKIYEEKKEMLNKIIFNVSGQCQYTPGIILIKTFSLLKL